MIAIGVASWCLDVIGPKALFRAAELNIKAVQIDAGNPGDENYIGNPKTLKSYQEISRISTVDIVGIGAKFINDLGMTEDWETQTSQECRILILDTIRAAVYLGAKFVFFPSFRKSEIRSPGDFSNAARLIKQACTWAKPHNINVGSENSLGCEGNRKLLNLVGKPNFRILVDSYNPSVFGHSAASLIRELSPYIAQQVHLKDGIDYQAGTVPLGTGEGRFYETMTALSSISFDGVILLENKYTNKEKSFIAQDLRTVRSIEV